MPGDIVDIDGITTVEIAWINGDKLSLYVPKTPKEPFKGMSVSQEIGKVEIILLATAYDSGFRFEGLVHDIKNAIFGVTIGKGVDALIESIPYVGRIAKLGIDYAKGIEQALRGVDLSEIDLTTKTRIRSKVLIDTTGTDLEVYNIEGSPDIQTVAGEEITLENGQAVRVTDEGFISPVETFDPEAAENEFLDDLEKLQGEEDSDPDGTPSSTSTPSPTATAADTGLTFESRSKPQGSEVQIPLTLKGIPERVGNMDMTLSYDTTVLQALEVIKGSLTQDSLMDHNIQDGTIRISLADNDGFAGDGSVAYVRYNVVGSEGSSSPLDIEEASANNADNYAVLDMLTHNGIFTVIGAEESIGDCDGDGHVSVVDALCALQMAVGKKAEDLAMDINGDGKVTSLDARSILRLAVESV